MELKIRKPNISELPLLSSLALRSKAYWGYDDEFIEACREELTLRNKYLVDHIIFVAEHGHEIAGFYVLEEINSRKIELTFLFIEPKFINKGIGKTLFQHAISLAEEYNYKSIIIQSDPFAEEFYISLGCYKIGMKPSASIENRDLPLLEYNFEMNRVKQDSEASG